MAKEHELLSLSFSWPHTYKLIVSLVLRDQEMVIALNRCAQKAKIQRHFITMREKTNKKNRQSCKHFFVLSETDFPTSKLRMKGGKIQWGTICRWTRISARGIKPNMAQDTSGFWRTSKRQTSRWWLQLHQYRKFQRYKSTV